MIQDRDVLMISMRRFYAVGDNIDRMNQVLRGNDASLRTIEWFVTHYAKVNDVVVSCSGGPINVYHSYRSALKTYSKEQFDPFRRHERILFRFGGEAEDEIETTVGQLNFFKWAIETGVLNYIRENRHSIDRAMLDAGVSKRARVSDASTADERASDKPPSGDRPMGKVMYKICDTILTFD